MDSLISLLHSIIMSIIDSLIHCFTESSVHWFNGSLIHWFIGSIGSQPPFAHSLMDLATSTAYGFCISRMFLQAIDSYSHFLFSKLPPRGGPGTIWYVYSNQQYDIWGRENGGLTPSYDHCLLGKTMRTTR